MNDPLNIYRIVEPKPMVLEAAIPPDMGMILEEINVGFKIGDGKTHFSDLRYVSIYDIDRFSIMGMYVQQ